MLTELYIHCRLKSCEVEILFPFLGIQMHISALVVKAFPQKDNAFGRTMLKGNWNYFEDNCQERKIGLSSMQFGAGKETTSIAIRFAGIGY